MTRRLDLHHNFLNLLPAAAARRRSFCCGAGGCPLVGAMAIRSYSYPVRKVSAALGRQPGLPLFSVAAMH